MQLNNLKPHTSKKRSQLVGRGGKRGKTSGRGTKGQKARAGHKIRPESRDMFMRLPKLRGYSFKTRFKDTLPVSLTLVDKKFAAGEAVNPKSLVEKGLLTPRAGVLPVIKILGGKITKKIAVTGCAVSASARDAITKAGGSIAP